MSGIDHDQPHPELRARVRELCARFPDEYWRRLSVLDEQFGRTKGGAA